MVVWVEVICYIHIPVAHMYIEKAMIDTNVKHKAKGINFPCVHDTRKCTIFFKLHGVMAFAF